MTEEEAEAGYRSFLAWKEEKLKPYKAALDRAKENERRFGAKRDRAGDVYRIIRDARAFNLWKRADQQHTDAYVALREAREAYDSARTQLTIDFYFKDKRITEE